MAASTTSAFWLHKNTPDFWTEIDVMELVLPHPRIVPTSLHVIREAGTEVVPGGSLRYSKQLSFDAAQIPTSQTYFNSFHTYGVDWNKDTIDIYLDGVLLRSHPNDRWHHPLSINVTNSIQEWNGLPTSAQLAAAEPMLVDYIRVYGTEPRNELDHPGFEYPGAAGATDAASWTENPWLQRTSADAHSGEWSVRADNSIPNASGSSQWKKLQPSQTGFEVSPATAVTQQVWVKKIEEFPMDTARKMELVLRWNGLSTGATTASFDLADLQLGQWSPLAQTTFVPTLDATGNPVTFVEVVYMLNNQSESAQMDGTLLLDDAFFGRAIQNEPQLLSGDFNHDGMIDAADYVVWRKNAGGIYTQNDVNIWRADFGQTVASGSAPAGVENANVTVPEPTTQTTVVVAMMLMVARERAGKLLRSRKRVSGGCS